MPRKKTVYTDQYPYHIMARSNNRQWFYIEKSKCWQIFRAHLNAISEEMNFEINSFVLMDNHYHLTAWTKSDPNLGSIMCKFQTSVSKEINRIAGRINHVFGGRYKACLIKDKYYFAHVQKYIYRNPIDAGLVKKAEDYGFSTLNSKDIIIAQPKNQFGELIPEDSIEYLSWINQEYLSENRNDIKNALRKTTFELKKTKLKKSHPLSKTIF